MVSHFNSVYGLHMQQFIELKRKLGFKFEKNAKLLLAIDIMAIHSQQLSPGITKDFADQWVKKRLHENPRNQYSRATCLAQFSSYLCSIGIRSYVPKLPPVGRSTFIPHIYSPEEINALFAASDGLRLSAGCLNCSLISFPLLIRTLYSTGIRIGEAIVLKDEDLNLDENYLRIRDSKNGKERIVPISETLAENCRQYLSYREKIPLKKKSAYFFTKLDGLQLHPATVGTWLRKCLSIAGIPYIGRYQGPRLHDLRHTFAVTSLANMADAGVDLYVSLPILSTYLGHQSIEATNHYVRLTRHIYPDLIKDVNLICQDVFPKYQSHDETN
jgi:integrase/recombinase XerD